MKRPRAPFQPDPDQLDLEDYINMASPIDHRPNLLKCPKCGATSGDDWSQCGPGPCPMRKSEAHETAPPAEYPASFADYPESLTERTANSKDRGDIWSARDVLICALRELDQGLHPTENCVVVFHGDINEVDAPFSMFQRSPSRGALLGVLERVKMRLYQNSGGA